MRMHLRSSELDQGSYTCKVSVWQIDMMSRRKCLSHVHDIPNIWLGRYVSSDAYWKQCRVHCNNNQALDFKDIRGRVCHSHTRSNMKWPAHEHHSVGKHEYKTTGDTGQRTHPIRSCSALAKYIEPIETLRSRKDQRWGNEPPPINKILFLASFHSSSPEDFSYSARAF